MEAKPNLGLGEYLRSEREKRHITIEQVASATKINIKLLHALEGDNYDALPAKPFVRGFVTSYTRYVGLDYREVLTRFEPFLNEKSGQKFKRPEDAPHIFVEKEGQSDNSKTALSIVMVSCLVIGLLFFAIVKPSLKHKKSSHKKAVTNEEVVTVVPPPSDNSPLTVKSAPKKIEEAAKAAKPEEPNEPTAAAIAPVEPPPVPQAPAKPTVPVAAPAPATAQATTTQATATASAEKKPATQKVGWVKLPPIPQSEIKQRLVVQALDDAWVKYQADDRPVQAYMLRKGKKIFVNARTSLRFTTGKPTALEISYDNEEFTPMGSNTKLIVLPRDAESQYVNQPFVDVNPTYLSTPNQ